MGPQELTGGHRSSLDQDVIEAGTHDFEIVVHEANEDEYSDYILDVGGVADDRYEYDWNNDNGNEYDFDEDDFEPAYLDGPEPKPDLVRVLTEDVTVALSITDVTVDVEEVNGEPLAEIGIGVVGSDQEFDVATNTTSHSIEYDELTSGAVARLGLGRRDVEREGETPLTGFEAQQVDVYEMFASLDDTPVVADWTFEGTLMEAVQELADKGNFATEIRPAGQDADADFSFEMTRIGQRDTDADSELVEYNLEKQTEDVVERAIVVGASQSVRREAVTVEVDEAVELNNERLRSAGRETVYDPDDEDTTYERGVDYEINPRFGELTALEDGALEDGDEARADYEFSVSGEFDQSTGSVDDPRTETVRLPDLTTSQACDLAALYIVQETGTKLWEVDVTVPADATAWSVIESIDPEQLPGKRHLQIREVDQDDRSQRLRLASRKSVSEIVDDLERITQRTIRAV